MGLRLLKVGLVGHQRLGMSRSQDRGRLGYYNVGIPPSGALDQFSLSAANLLVVLSRVQPVWYSP